MHDAVFKCDLSAPYKLKSDVFSLILPMFALDGKATNEAIIYYKDLYLKINPINKAIGRATIKDKAILVFCLSQLMVKLNNSYKTGNIASFTAYDFLTTIGKGTTGKDYKDLEKSLQRLNNTRITTNLTVKGISLPKEALLIAGYRYNKTTAANYIEVILPEWLIECAHKGIVLDLHSTYFELSRPLHRRIYEICRQKHGGHKPKGKISISNLHTLVGSGSSVAKFRCDIRELTQTSKIPGFTLTLQKSLLHINKTLQKPEQPTASSITNAAQS
jgi:plasmid replication initiation protein